MTYKLSHFEIYENVHGKYRIFDTKTDELVTFGGTALIFDTAEEAAEFLEENNLI